MTTRTLTDILAWFQAHQAAYIAAAVLASALVLAGARLLRSARLASILRTVTLPLVLLWEAQGLYRVGLRIHAPVSMALILAAITSAALLTSAAYAEQSQQKHGRLGTPGRLMWVIAVFEAAVVAANSQSPAEFALRIVLPLLSVIVFKLPYLVDPADDKQQRPGSWVWTPRRIGVALGLLDATAGDLRTVQSERHVRRLVAHALGYHDGPAVFRWWHRRRFTRLMRMATEPMLDETVQRIERVRSGLSRVAPPKPSGSPSGSPSGESSGDPSGNPSETPPEVASGKTSETASETTAGTVPKPAPKRPRKPTPAQARKMTAEDLALVAADLLGPDPSKQAVMRELHVGAPKAAAILDVLRDPGAEIIPLAQADTRG